jgi:hypothetical protein
VSDLAHLGPVELYTPKAEESLTFFVETMSAMLGLLPVG